MKWQDIDTAPKDGTEVLVWDRMVLRACWDDPWDSGNSSWHLGACLAFGDESTECNPTHWMPLPNAPESLNG